MANCPLSLCTGTHYLSDVPELGSCPGCCTPENMQRLDRTIAALVTPKPLTEQLDELEGMVSEIRDAFRAMEGERDEADAVRDRAADRLQKYLVSIEYAASPVSMPAGPLRDLCATLDIVEGE